jgi:tRNA threonylcarbamoyl adenosine modification protein YeaZ
MKLLAWDTSSRTAALVAMEWDENDRLGWPGVRLVGESTLNVDLTHSERLLWAIDELLEAARWKLKEVGVFGVGIGPGSFTGLRIGVTTARTLAHSLHRELVGVSSLAALARPTAQWLSSSFLGSGLGSGAGRHATVVACTDACKGELFALWGAPRAVNDCVVLASGDARGLWKRGVEEEVLSPESLMKSLRLRLKGSQDFWIAIGEGRKRYPDAWKSLPPGRELACPQPFLDQVQGRFVGQLAWEAVQAGLAREALSVHPRYLRASDAELRLRAGKLKKAPTLPPRSGNVPS